MLLRAFKEKGFSALAQWGMDCDVLLATSMSLIASQNHSNPYNPAWITYVTGFVAVCSAAHAAYSLYQDYKTAPERAKTWATLYFRSRPKTDGSQSAATLTPPLSPKT